MFQNFETCIKIRRRSVTIRENQEGAKISGKLSFIDLEEKQIHLEDEKLRE